MISPAASKFTVSSVIRDILLNDPAIKEAVSGKIYPLYAPKDIKGDFILYKRDEYSIDYTKMGIATQKCKVFVNVISDDYTRGQQIAEMVFKALHGDYEGGMKIRLIDSTEDTADRKYVQVLLFSIE